MGKRDFVAPETVLSHQQPGPSSATQAMPHHVQTRCNTAAPALSKPVLSPVPLILRLFVARDRRQAAGPSAGLNFSAGARLIP